MTWTIAVLLVLIVAATILRFFSGNLYKRASASFEQRFRLRMETVLRVIGVLTVVAWIVVFLSAGEGDKKPLSDLVPKLFEGPSDQVPKD